MVEPLFFAAIPQGIAPGDSIEIGGQEAKHAISVRRMRLGERIAVGDGKTLKVHGSVFEIGQDFLRLEVQSIEEVKPPKVEIYLVQALAKGDRDELAIQASTELGIAGVIPWQAERSVSVWKGDKATKGVARWQSIVAEAAKQSLRPRIPMVSDLTNTAELFKALERHTLILVLDPTATQSIVDLKLPETGTIAVVVGPEGGISASELEAFEASSFNLVHLGPGVLRTSTAGVAAISYLKAALGEWA